MVLKANDRRTSCPCHDEFRGPRSDYVRQKAYRAVVLERVKARNIKEMLNEILDHPRRHVVAAYRLNTRHECLDFP
ncbi:hypothetical protein TNCV_822761 [Trichonephila clavipes]|nr:hypothetical protein TNCV_822761 [Trichonephila clavipes]